MALNCLALRRETARDILLDWGKRSFCVFHVPLRLQTADMQELWSRVLELSCTVTRDYFVFIPCTLEHLNRGYARVIKAYPWIFLHWDETLHKVYFWTETRDHVVFVYRDHETSKRGCTGIWRTSVLELRFTVTKNWMTGLFLPGCDVWFWIMRLFICVLYLYIFISFGTFQDLYFSFISLILCFHEKRNYKTPKSIKKF